MNPSTDDILNAIMQTPAKTVFVLPNNKNIIMAAEQAANLSQEREVRVLQTRTVPEGIAAMLVFDEDSEADDNEMAMTSAADSVETGLVTFAARDSEVDGKPIKQGEIMGLANGKIRHIGTDREEIAFKTADKLFKKKTHSLVTLIFGEGVSERDAEKVEKLLKDKYKNDMEISIINGGQPVYDYVIILS